MIEKQQAGEVWHMKIELVENTKVYVCSRSEEPKRQTGEWIERKQADGKIEFECIACLNRVAYHANYCDCCGADMRESNITEALVKEFYPNT